MALKDQDFRRRQAAPMVVAALFFAVPFIVWAAPYERVAPQTLKAGDAIPRPGGEIVLIVNGATQNGKARGPLRFDIATLEKIGLIRYTAKNRWYDPPPVFEGVLGSAFLEVVGVPEGATVMEMRALNDYTTTIPISDFRRWPIMLALKMNGEYMPVRTKGPVWIVYPTHVEEALALPPHQGRWIWQLAEIAFK